MSIDQCIGRGCGGLLGGVEREIFDGSTALCGACGREHTFHVAHDGGPVSVTIERIDYRRQRREYKVAIAAAERSVIHNARAFAEIHRDESKTIGDCEAIEALLIAAVDELDHLEGR